MTTLLITFTLDDGLGKRTRTIHDFNLPIEEAVLHLQNELNEDGEYIPVDPTPIMHQRSSESVSFISKLTIAVIDIELNPHGGLQ